MKENKQITMSDISDCPYCGRKDVVDRLLNNSFVPGLALSGGSFGLLFGPLGLLVGAPVGAAVGKVLNSVTGRNKKKSYSFKCPSCGGDWQHDILSER